MVDVSQKPATARVAVARGAVQMAPETLGVVRAGSARKGDVLGVARLAGIMAAKRTVDLIPLCHPLALTSVEVDLWADEETSRVGVLIEARVGDQGPDRRRDGGADGGVGRGADGLRHAQGRRPGDGDRGHPRCAEGRRRVRAATRRRDAARPRRATMLSVAEAHARLMALVRAACRRRMCRWPRRPDGFWRATWSRRATSRRSPPRRWTATRSARRRGRGARLRVIGTSQAGKRFVGGGRARRGGADLHRRAGSRGRRRDPDPGGRRRGRRRDRRCATAGTPRDHIRPAGGDFRRRCAAGRAAAAEPGGDRAGGGDERRDDLGDAPSGGGADPDRRRTRAAGRRARVRTRSSPRTITG